MHSNLMLIAILPVHVIPISLIVWAQSGHWQRTGATAVPVQNILEPNNLFQWDAPTHWVQRIQNLAIGHFILNLQHDRQLHFHPDSLLFPKLIPLPYHQANQLINLPTRCPLLALTFTDQPKLLQPHQDQSPHHQQPTLKLRLNLIHLLLFTKLRPLEPSQKVLVRLLTNRPDQRCHYHWRGYALTYLVHSH